MRVKRGTTKKQRHKKVLEQAKGYRLTKSKLYRRALDAVRHAGKYSFAHRRRRKTQMREIWIQRINAGLQAQGVKYSEFINMLAKKEITLNRKVLAELALDEQEVFAEVVKFASK